MSDDLGDHIDAILAQWRRERPDLDLAPMAILGRLFRATALADAALAPPLAALGLQPGWTDLLAALRRAGRPVRVEPDGPDARDDADLRRDHQTPGSAGRGWPGAA